MNLTQQILSQVSEKIENLVVFDTTDLKVISAFPSVYKDFF